MSNPPVPADALAASTTDLAAAIRPAIPVATDTVAYPSADEIAKAVVDRLLLGHGIMEGIPDDVGVPPAFRLGTPYQNYLIWAGRNGAAWGLADPNTMVRMAVMLTAMARLGEDATPQQLAQAAQDALEGLDL